MKSIFLILAGAVFCLTQCDIRAAQITCAGVLGNSGEQGQTLVRFGAVPANGLGVVHDETGSLWDRGGDGVLNRYALDGRLLATYKIPASHVDANDRIIRLGNNLVLDIAGKLYKLPLDAAPGAAATPFGVQADMMSFGSANGSIAIATLSPDRKSWSVSLFDPETRQTTPLIDGPLASLQDIELTPDKGLVANSKWQLQLFRNGKAVTEGWPRSGPGDRLQLLDGFWYGSVWHGTIRRFNAELEPDPGVVLGGGSGAFIGHVDGNMEIEACRGLAAVQGNLFAGSGMYGILQLLNWSKELQQFQLIRRIGAVQLCQGLGINRQGRVWYNSGYWNWDDSPASILHDCTAAGPGRDTPGIGQLVLLPGDNFVAPEIRNGHTQIIGGPFAWNVFITDLKDGPTTKTGLLNGSAVYMNGKIQTLITINAAGEGETWRVDTVGKMIADLGQTKLQTQDPVKEWTSLAMKNADTLLGAGDGSVIEMTRGDGDIWRETKRWNSWQGAAPSAFGGKIYICSDAGNLWVSDTEHHRVLCFGLADGTLRATFGAGQAGDDLGHLNGPRAIAARESRAVVFDSGNQRIVKLVLGE